MVRYTIYKNTRSRNGKKNVGDSEGDGKRQMTAMEGPVGVIELDALILEASALGIT